MNGVERLAGKVVLITGSSAGIGEAVARILAPHGCKLVLVARRRERLIDLKEQLSKLTSAENIFIEKLDVTDGAAVEKFANEDLPEQFRNVDILVNNAGGAHGLDRVHEVQDKDLQTMIEVNVKGLLYMQRAFVPGMIQRNTGHVINISSIAGRNPYPGGGVYCGTKAMVDSITSALRMELVKTNVKVTSIAPGMVETEFSMVRFHGDSEKAANVYRGLEPLGPEDIADNVLYAVTRPVHVVIADMLVLPNCQAGAYHIHKA
eukprot:Clim_evm80s144 gene=Clim_evmTU80s144